MSTERSVNSTIRTTLLNNEAFEYAHLVKIKLFLQMQINLYILVMEQEI